MKEHPVFISLCQHVLEDISLCVSLSEDQVLLFIDELASAESAMMEAVEKEFTNLCSAVGEVWQYREWEKMSPEQAFLYGSLWGSIKSFECRRQKSKKADHMKLLVPKFKDKRWLFRAIKSQPGILHKELAAKGKITPSRLSQIMDDEDMNDLISYHLSGREKYYFLKPKGEELLLKLKSGDGNVLGSYTEPYKAISMDNENKDPSFEYQKASAMPEAYLSKKLALLKEIIQEYDLRMNEAWLDSFLQSADEKMPIKPGQMIKVNMDGEWYPNSKVKQVLRKPRYDEELQEATEIGYLFVEKSKEKLSVDETGARVYG